MPMRQNKVKQINFLASKRNSDTSITPSETAEPVEDFGKAKEEIKKLREQLAMKNKECENLR